MRIYKSIMAVALILMGLAVQAQSRRELDSLRKAVTKQVTDTGRVDAYLKVGEAYLDDQYNTNLTDSGDLYLRRARELNKKHYVAAFQNRINLLSAKVYMGRNPRQDPKKLFFPLIDDCQKAADKANEALAWDLLADFSDQSAQAAPFRLNCYQHAVSLAHEINDRYQEYDDLRQIADIHFKQQKFDLAETELSRILKDANKAGHENIMFTDDLLAAVYTSKAQYDKALFYALKTIKTMQVQGDSTTALTFYGRLCYLSSILGNTPMLVYWAKMGLNNAIITKKPEFIYAFVDDVINGLLKEGKTQEALKFIGVISAKYKPSNWDDVVTVYKLLGNCYYALKQNKLAENYYLKMINDVKKDTTDASSGPACYSVIGQFYFNNNRYAKAKIYLLQAFNQYKIHGGVGFLEKTDLYLFRVDSALGDYKSAIKHLQEGSKLKDSMFTVAKNKQIEELNITYQTAERQKDLKIAQNQANLERVQLQHTQTIRNWIIAGSGLLLIIAGLLYRQSSLRRKNNELITHKNELLQHLLTEKEWLLKEVHHRVKNNLHTVICLLESQARYLENDALKAIENSQHRIYAMSLIHQKLYQSDDIKTIDMAEYIPELIKSLEEGFATADQIKFKLNIDPVNLDISHAIPLGLIINEAVTNSIKYAFPIDRKGEISISMRNDSGRIKLELADNGIGMPHVDPRNEPESLGLRLMKGLSEDIDAAISFEVDNGTRITIVFDVDPLNNGNTLSAGAINKGVYV